ncbi:MAG: ATPase [Actinomycetia bacterium]|nr:ATPase [Actinomycetes bacterium]
MRLSQSSPRLHIVTGKGGTGKTTAAAALATALAAGGHRVLAIEVEGRQGFAQLYGVPPLPYDERRLAVVAGGGEVMGLAIDPELALLEYLELFYNLKRAGRLLQRMGAIDFVTTLAPGLRDVLLTGKIKEAANRAGGNGRPRYHAVVLDAPPTGRVRQFLDATKEVVNLTKAGPISRQSAGVIDFLHSDRTAIHLVTLLEEMPVQETVDAAVDLAAAGYRIGSVIVNRARPVLVRPGQVGPDGRVDAAALARGLTAARVDARLASPLAAQLADYAARQATQSAAADMLAAVDVPRVELPYLNPPVELSELADLAAHFVGTALVGTALVGEASGPAPRPASASRTVSAPAQTPAPKQTPARTPADNGTSAAPS